MTHDLFASKVPHSWAYPTNTGAHTTQNKTYCKLYISMIDHSPPNRKLGMAYGCASHKRARDDAY